MKQPSLTILIPVYNESAGIQIFLDQQLAPVLKTISAKITLLMINDGSTDDSLSAIQHSAIIHQYPTTIISFTRNFGKENALAAGLHYVDSDATVIIDADGQHPAAAIPKMLKLWQKGAKIITAIDKRNQTKHRFSSKVYYKIMRWMGNSNLAEGAMDFRLLDRAVVTEYNRLTERHRITRGLIDWLGFPQTYIKVTTKKRAIGTPTYSLKKLLALASDSLFSMSNTPLVIFGAIGVFITIFSFILGVFTLIQQYILGDPLHLDWNGAVALCFFIAFLVGLVLISQSITAMYISQIHAEAKNRPLYVIDWSKTTNLKES